MTKEKIVIFDLDGVITSEEIYWDCCRLTLLKIIEGEDFFGLTNAFSRGRQLTQEFQYWKDDILSEEEIVEFKNMAVNSNWDITYLILSLVIIFWLKIDSQISQDIKGLLEKDGNFWEKALMILKEKLRLSQKILAHRTIPLKKLCHSFFDAAGGLKGQDLFGFLSIYAERQTGIKNLLFRKRDSLWSEVNLVFQFFCNCPGNRFPKGPVKDQESILDYNKIRQILNELKQKGVELAIATGRPRTEAIPVLKEWRLLNLFKPSRIVTADEVRKAEKYGQVGEQYLSLSKPHPFSFLKAAFPDRAEQELLQWQQKTPPNENILVVGDSASDMIGAKRANFIAVAVLTGLGKALHLKKRRAGLLLQTGADIIINDITELPEIMLHFSKGVSRETTSWISMP